MAADDEIGAALLDVEEDEDAVVDGEGSPVEEDMAPRVDVVTIVMTGANWGLVLTGGLGGGLGTLVSYKGLRTPPMNVLVF